MLLVSGDVELNMQARVCERDREKEGEKWDIVYTQMQGFKKCDLFVAWLARQLAYYTFYHRVGFAAVVNLYLHVYSLTLIP